MAVEDIYVKLNLDTKSFDGSLTGIKKEMAALRGYIGSSLLSKEDSAVLSARFGQLRDSMEDIKLGAQAIATQDVFGNMARFGSIASSAISGVVGVTSLLGAESKKVAEVERQMLTLISVASTLQQVADAKRLKGLAMEYVEMGKNMLLVKSQKVLTIEQTAAEQGLTAMQYAKAQGIGVATKAQLLWNAAIKANPIGIMVTAILGLVAAIGLLAVAFSKNTNEVKNYEKALDGTVIKDEELRKSYNESIITLQDLTREYKVLTGSLSDYGAEVDKVNQDLINSTDNLAKELSKSFEEIDAASKGFFSGLWQGLSEIPAALKAAFNGEVFISEAEKKTIAAQDAYNTKLEAKQKESAQRLLNLQKKHEQETTDAIVSYRVSRLREIIGQLNQEYDAVVQSNEKILSLYKTLSGKQKELRERGLTPEQKELQGIKDYFDNYKAGVEDVGKELEKEKSKLKDIQVQIESNQALRDKFLGIEKQIGGVISQQRETSKKDLEVLETKITALRKSINETLGLPQGNKTTVIGDLSQMPEAQQLNELLAQKTLIQQTITDLEVKSLSAQQDRIKLEKEIADNKQKQTETEQKILELNQKQTEEKSKVVEVSGSELAEKQAQEEEVIRQKYANERKKSITQDELEISRIKSGALDDLANAENTSLEKRKALILERNKELEREIALIQELLRLNIAQLQAEMDLLDANDPNREVLQSKIVKETAQANDAIVKLKTKIETPPNLSPWEDGINNLFGGIFTKWDELDFQGKVDGVLSMVSTGLQVFSDFANTIMQIQADKMAQHAEMVTAQITADFERANKEVDELVKFGLITQEQADKKREQAEAEKLKKEKELKKEQAKAEKKQKLYSAIIGTAQAVISGLATAPFLPLGIIMGALAAVLGGIQIAAIASEPLPEFAKGGYVTGNSHALGGQTVVAEGGEFIVNKKAAQAPNMAPVLQSINNGTYQQQPGITQEDIRTIVQEVARIPVVNVETESTRVQRRVATIETSATW